MGDDIDKLDARALDEAVAVEVCGWRRVGIPHSEAVAAAAHGEEPCAGPWLCEPHLPDTCGTMDFPRYSADPNDAFAMEEEIQRRGLAMGYVSLLAEIVQEGMDGEQAMWQVEFAIAHASPRDRCRAALRAARAEGKGE